MQSVSKLSTAKEKGIKIVHLKVNDLADNGLACAIMVENPFKTLQHG